MSSKRDPMGERIFFSQTLFLDLHVLSIYFSLTLFLFLFFYNCFRDFRFIVSYFRLIGGRASQHETISYIFFLSFVIAFTLATISLVLDICYCFNSCNRRFEMWDYKNYILL
jgi:hypothetical protein